MLLQALAFYVFAFVRHGVGRHGRGVAQSRLLGAVPDPGLLQRRRAVRADRRRVHRHDPDHRLCRRRGRAVPVRRHDARHQPGRAARRLPRIPAGRRHDRRRAAGRDPARPGRARRRLDRPWPALGKAGAAGDGDRQHPRHRPRALHPVLLPLPGRGPGAAGRHDRRHRADPAHPARRAPPARSASSSTGPRAMPSPWSRCRRGEACDGRSASSHYLSSPRCCSPSASSASS